MKTMIAMILVVSSNAFAVGDEADTNASGYVDTTNYGFGHGDAGATGKFKMSIEAEGKANMEGTTSATGENGMYGQGYRTPYYGYSN
jgi:hypothetical protein